MSEPAGPDAPRRILIVAATEMEVRPVIVSLHDRERADRFCSGRYGAHVVDVLVTGVGMVATAACTSDALARNGYDVAFNLGVCGAFDRRLALGTVTHVVSDTIAELGAEDGEAFLSVHDLGLLGHDDRPFTGGRLVNAHPPENAVLSELPTVAGITVNTGHGHEPSIERIAARLQPQVESMEGAAFMYSCLMAGVPFAQVRAVSNIVERRNRAAWDVAGAVGQLGSTALRILDAA